MKIAFVINQNAIISGASNGVRSQALTWHDIIKNTGHECVLVNHWENYDWASFDAIHIFGYDIGIFTFISALFKKNPNIFLSPIIDSQRSYFAYRVATYNGLISARLFSNNYALRKALVYVKGVCVRSDHEGKYFHHSFGLPADMIFKVPLSFGIEVPESIDHILNMKQNYCLHVSSLYQERKNVIRLVQAARKYGFPLILVGNTGTSAEFEPIRKAIGNAGNITVLGFISNPELIQLYERAKAFALPSLFEGVGIVALDAAVYGCNIAMTNIKGPSEYWPNCPNVLLTDPLDIDDIGQKINQLINTSSSRTLYDHVRQNYSREAVSIRLQKMYQSTRIGLFTSDRKI